MYNDCAKLVPCLVINNKGSVQQSTVICAVRTLHPEHMNDSEHENLALVAESGHSANRI
jgi:hypothetical protein